MYALLSPCSTRWPMPRSATKERAQSNSARLVVSSCSDIDFVLADSRHGKMGRNPHGWLSRRNYRPANKHRQGGITTNRDSRTPIPENKRRLLRIKERK